MGTLESRSYLLNMKLTLPFLWCGMLCLCGFFPGCHAEPECFAETGNVNGLKLGARLREFADNDLGLKQIQANYDEKSTFQKSIPDRDKITQELSLGIASRFQELNQAVLNLKVAAEQEDTNQTHSFMSCCNDTEDLTDDDDFKTEVDKHSTCERLAKDAKLDRPLPGKSYLDAAIKNHDDISFLKWQYLGTEDGGTVIYPRHKANCIYEPRNRPWYRATSTPDPKDIVIVFSYTGTELDMIKELVITIIQTTNPNDKVGIVRFADNPYTPSGCFSTQLALATTLNTKELIKFVNLTERSEGESTHYVRAITTGFKLFGDESTASKKVLLFVVDRDPNDAEYDTIPEKVKKENKHNALVMTFRFGKVNNKTEGILKKMAEETHIYNSESLRMQGTYTKFNRTDRNLRYRISQYYNALSRITKQPVLVVPYEDLWGLGLVISICLPMYSGNMDKSKLRGVVCVDGTMGDLLSNVTNFDHGEEAYSFIIDSGGRTIVHPSLHPAKGKWSPQAFLDISMLEGEAVLKDVIESMKRGETGNKTVLLSRPSLRMKITYPLNWVETNNLIHYFTWTKIPNTDYRLCTVFTNKDRETRVNLNSNVPLKPEVYKDPCPQYPWNSKECKDSSQWKTNFCMHRNSIVLLGSTYVTLHPKAYIYAPTDGISGNDVYNQANHLKDFFNSDIHFPLKENVKPEVRLTSLIEDVWNEQHYKKYGNMVFWRFLVTLNGIIRSYPGVKTAFKPTEMSWFNKALIADANTLILSLQQWNNAEISLFMSHAILGGDVTSGNRFLNRQPAGVLGAELNPEMIGNLLISMFPLCEQDGYRCFLLDESGFFLFHTHLNHSTPRLMRHINVQEEQIGNILYEQRILVNGTCSNWEDHKIVQCIKVRLTGGMRSICRDNIQFEMQAVHGTNLIVGIAKGHIHPANKNCRDIQGYSQIPFNHCLNKNSGGDLACPIILQEASTNLAKMETDLLQLEQCKQSDCKQFYTERKCTRYFCRWCPGIDKCSSDWKCPRTPPERYNPIPIIAGVLVAAGLIILVVVSILIFSFKNTTGLCCLRKEKKSDGEKHGEVGPYPEIPDDENYIELQGIDDNDCQMDSISLSLGPLFSTRPQPVGSQPDEESDQMGTNEMANQTECSNNLSSQTNVKCV